MLSHEKVWEALDALATRYSLSPSGLAKRAGLDPTAFNRSKRYSGDGRPRWPSTESLAKVFEATGASWLEFTALMEVPNHKAPNGWLHSNLSGFAEAGAGHFNREASSSQGQETYRPDLFGSISPYTFAFAIEGEAMLPLYRNGDIIIVDPKVPVRKGQRVFVQTIDGEVIVRILARSRSTHLELVTPTPAYPLRTIGREQVALMGRIIWASQ